MALEASLTMAHVIHKRLLPRQHEFQYTICYLYFTLEAISKLVNRFLSLDKFNLLSFYQKDHGACDGSNLESWARQILKRFGLNEADGSIILLTLPRMLGFVFNPVSFWFCLDHQGKLRAIISEVRNTFGERHSYISFHDDHRVIEPTDWLSSDKLFHVSPFLVVSGHYKFRFCCSDKNVSAHINYYNENGLVLVTSVQGTLQTLTSRSALKAFLLYPANTIKVIILIHYEALRLVLKGMRYCPKPHPPKEGITR